MKADRIKQAAGLRAHGRGPSLPIYICFVREQAQPEHSSLASLSYYYFFSAWKLTNRSAVQWVQNAALPMAVLLQPPRKHFLPLMNSQIMYIFFHLTESSFHGITLRFPGRVFDGSRNATPVMLRLAMWFQSFFSWPLGGRAIRAPTVQAKDIPVQ